MFRRISQFVFEVMRLPRQLSQLESNVEDECTRIDGAKLDLFQPAPVSAATFSAKIGQLVVGDTATRDVLVDLPIASSLNAGRIVAVAKTSATNGLTVRSIGQISDVLPSASIVYQYLSALMPGGTYTWLRTGG